MLIRTWKSGHYFHGPVYLVFMCYYGGTCRPSLLVSLLVTRQVYLSLGIRVCAVMKFHLAPNCRVLNNPVWCGFTLIPSPNIQRRSWNQKLSSGLMLVTSVTTHLFQTAPFPWLVFGAVLHSGRFMASESLAGSSQSQCLTVRKNMFVLRYSQDAHHLAASWQG